MRTLACFLEEESAKILLQSVLPKIIPEDVDVCYFAFQGKQDLDKNLEKKLRFWQKPDTVFLVFRDKDSGDCLKIKAGLLDKIAASKISSGYVVRIACSELESFYLGDLEAVEKGFGITGLSKKQGERKFRAPDNLGNAAQTLEQLTNNSYGKLSGARKIAPYLKVDGTNCSYSFNVLLSGIKGLLS
jgi:hypothetical protein